MLFLLYLITLTTAMAWCLDDNLGGVEHKDAQKYVTLTRESKDHRDKRTNGNQFILAAFC